MEDISLRDSLVNDINIIKNIKVPMDSIEDVAIPLRLVQKNLEACVAAIDKVATMIAESKEAMTNGGASDDTTDPAPVSADDSAE